MNRMAMWITVLATSCGVAACLSLAPAQNASGSFTFGLFGDLAYVPQQEPEMQRVLDEVNATPDLAFVAHVGDLAGTNACPNEFWDRRLAQFQASRHPLIYTPGDNEWVDCHEKAAGAYDPLERLARLRTVFFPDEQTLGQRRFRVERQSADPKFRNYRENARWQIQGITFFTLHNTGSNNNLGRYPAGDAEHRERTAANIEWMRQGFEQARASGARGVMIIQQANMFPDYLPYPARPKGAADGFEELRVALQRETQRFSGPVVLAHGDTHYFRVDKPIGMRAGKAVDARPSIENFTRVELFGMPNHHWVQVTVDPNDRQLFSFRQRIVEQNIYKGPR